MDYNYRISVWMGYSTGMIKRFLGRLNHDEKEDNYGQTI